MKLQIKVTLLVIAILIVIGIISGGIMLNFQRSASVSHFEHMAKALAGAVQSSLEHSMLTDNREMTQEALVDISEEEMVRNISLFSSDGTIAASSEILNIGKVTDRNEIQQIMRSDEGDIWTKLQPDTNEFLVITPILNKPECQDCHNPNMNTLGAIQVSLDSEPLDNQTRQQTIFFVVFGGLTFVILGFGLSFALRSIILKPLTILSQSAQRFSQGDYTVRTKGGKNDEIGMLAHTFNEMADGVEQRSKELEDSRQELSRWNIELEQRVQERTDQLSALNDIITTVSQSLNLEWILNAALAEILTKTSIESGAVHLMNKQYDQLNIVVHRGFSPEYFREITRLKLGEEIIGRVAHSGEPIVVNETIDNHKATVMMGERGKFRAYTILPLKSKNKIIGTLSLASYIPNKFTPEIVDLLQAMTDAISIVVENAIATKRLEELNTVREQLLEKLLLAQEEERRRIARQLHDDASQSLAAVIMHLEDIADDLPVRYRDTKQRLNMLREQATQTLEGIRDLALELRPSVLDDLGLLKAIDWYVKDFLVKRGIDSKIEFGGLKNKLPSNVEIILFRITQEAITNVVKHTNASKVNIRMQRNNSKVILQIEDNGEGFNVEAALTRSGEQQSLGLHGMQERTALLGGHFNIRSQIGRGTCVSIEIPLAEETI